MRAPSAPAAGPAPASGVCGYFFSLKRPDILRDPVVPARVTARGRDDSRRT